VADSPKSNPKSIRFTEEELQRIQKAIVKKIGLEGKTCIFSEFVVDAVLKEVKKIEEVRVKNMMSLALNVYYGRDISSYKDAVVTRLKESYPLATIEVGGDLLSFKIETDKNREALANEVQEELKKIIKR